MEVHDFRYEPRCSTIGCDRAPSFKVAALWSNGTSRELKHFGLACDDHRQDRLERARIQSESLRLAEGESIGAVGLYRLERGSRDLELQRLPEIEP